VVLFTVAKYGKVYWEGHAGVLEMGKARAKEFVKLANWMAKRSIRW
jgi:hypothetical protein